MLMEAVASWAAWLVPVALGAPWITGIAYYWRRSKPLDGSVPPSMADMARKRLWTP
jgi:hypothetical protein